MSKETLSLYLPVDLVAAVRGEAERRGVHVSDLAASFLREGLNQYRAKVRHLHAIEILDSLPTTLVDVPDTHPIFSHGKSGEGPFPVSVKFS